MAVWTALEPATSSVTVRHSNKLNYQTIFWLREKDLNQRPSGYEPDELPDCSIPRCYLIKMAEVEGCERPRDFHPLSVFKTDPFSQAWVNLRNNMVAAEGFEPPTCRV